MPTRDWCRQLFDSFSTLWDIKGLGFWVTDGRKAETWRHWRKGTTRSGACDMSWLNTGKTHQVHTQWGWTDRKLFLDSLGGRCMPVLSCWTVGLIHSVNDRDLSFLKFSRKFLIWLLFRGTLCLTRKEVRGKLRCSYRFRFWFFEGVELYFHCRNGNRSYSQIIWIVTIR